MSKNAKLAIGAVALLFLVASACAAFLWSADDPEVAQLKQVRNDMFAEDRTDEERRQMRDDFRGRIEQLSDDQRRDFFRDSRPMFINFARQRLDDFFTMPPDRQQQRIAEIADRIVERRSLHDSNGPSGAGRGPGGPRGNMTEGQRDERRKRMLDATDPKMRAQIDKFRDLLNDELKRRGEAPMDGPPRGLFR